MKIQYAILKFDELNLKPRDAEKIRGYFSKMFSENVLFHHHTNGKKLIYSYPFIQYKILENKPFIIGIEKGSDELTNIFLQIKEFDISGRLYTLLSKELKMEKPEFGLITDTVTYRFITPWFALNSNNFKKYINYNDQEKSNLLEAILKGNILSLSKYLKYTVDEKIIIKNMKLMETDFLFKNNKILGFKGTFSVNFLLPDYIGLGKSVSRGFGTIKRIT